MELITIFIIFFSILVVLGGSYIAYTKYKKNQNLSLKPTFQWTEYTPCENSTGKQSRGWIGSGGPAPEIKDCKVDCIQGPEIYGKCDKNTGKRLITKNILIHPLNDGLNCQQPYTENCSVDCEVAWKDWEKCNKTLGKQAQRYDIIYSPRNGGKPCPEIRSRDC